MLFDVNLCLMEDGKDYIANVVLGKAFIGPLQKRFVEYREQDFWTSAAEGAQSCVEAPCQDECFQMIFTES
jgi:hypothetical protein